MSVQTLRTEVTYFQTLSENYTDLHLWFAQETSSKNCA